ICIFTIINLYSCFIFFNFPVLAPSSVQELYELTVEAFNIADRYRILAMILGDGMLGQMMEAVEFKDKEDIYQDDKKWSCTGTNMERECNDITSIYIEPEVLENHNLKLQAKYRKIEENETRVEVYNCENADIIVTAYGTVARIIKNVIKMAEKEGIKVGLIRPITLWPFPTAAYEKYAETPKAFLSVELSSGQMVEDVRLAVNGKRPVHFYGRMGGMVPSQKEVMDKIKEILK
ncbi:MAG TPA: transketolase C-terminal domain-containing protein, partial [Ruminiclostridium sp.]|nr:transketolase C-terminal domain-containing protein [Ruminiclostridium sp.]